ncbi:hypothetical protein QUW15_00940 [Desulfovibrio piger]|nr:hypothetical protein [Desulfovibrio piger]
MTLPLLPALLDRLCANAGDYGAISRTLAEGVCTLEGALAAGVYLRDYAGETLFLAGRFPADATAQEEAPRLSAESWDDPLCYCLHTGLVASFTQISELCVLLCNMLFLLFFYFFYRMQYQQKNQQLANPCPFSPPFYHN